MVEELKLSQKTYYVKASYSPFPYLDDNRFYKRINTNDGLFNDNHSFNERGQI